jgi:Cytochrome c554 and c-prime
VTDPGHVTPRNGWVSALSLGTGVAVLFLAVTGLAVTFAPFSAAIEWALIVHTALGIVCLLPAAWYIALHWVDYRRYQISPVVLLGYVGAVALVVCLVSGVVVTWEGLFGIRISYAWRQTHLVSTYATLGAGVPHIVLLLVRLWRHLPQPRRYTVSVLTATAVGCAAVGLLPLAYAGTRYVNVFPKDYNFLYGKDRPFAPSLARTDTGGAFDARSLAGSESCGTAGCHTQIVDEWRPSAHRYAAMDPLFQGIQTVMAKQNGAESTRYCGGCHDPISLFSGTKNLFQKDLTSQHGFQEGVSCLSCHSVRETDVKGNANYTVTQPHEYLWQWADRGTERVARDFLIRTYPDEHNRLSKRMFKTPQYCAACHKQFIDKEVNRVGWVQLQNQYDNWASSHWNVKGDPTRTIECRECHMPLVESSDPAAGDDGDYNRTPTDGKHRSHRFIASNQLVPTMLKLPGWQDQVRLTEEWLQGRRAVPEIADKWATGEIVRLGLDLGSAVPGAATIPLRVVLTSNKVGHDYPTGPLDIIQSWVQLRVTDEQGREVFTSGTTDAEHFIAPGSFMLKAEPVDQHGNLIDRHNLWEMVGVRFRRALFPGYSDTFEYKIPCPAPLLRAAAAAADSSDTPGHRDFSLPRQRSGRYRIEAVLNYRKVDQYLLNFLLGAGTGVTAPVVQVAHASAVLEVGTGPDGALAASLVSDGGGR